jgi:endonuclease IV
VEAVDWHLNAGPFIPATDGLRFVAAGARALGCPLVQTLISDSEITLPSDQSAQDFAQLTYGIVTYLHASYRLNLAITDRARHFFYLAQLKKTMRMAELLGIKAVVLRPGYASDVAAGQDAVYRILSEIVGYADAPGVWVYLEIDPGSFGALGSPELIATVLRRFEHQPFALCLDTAHMWARGVNLFDAAVLEPFLAVYGDLIKLVHLNAPDFDVPLGSRLDRHNGSFQRSLLPCAYLIKRLLTAYPCVLERRSLGIQEQDLAFIRALK